MDNFIPADQLFPQQAAPPAPGFIPASELPFRKAPGPQEEKPEYKETEPKDFLDASRRQAIHHSNIMAGMQQGTSPHIDLHTPNILGDAWQDDKEKWNYTDYDNKDHPVMAKEAVVLQDPQTGKYHAFKRTPETDEHPLVGLGRWAMEGMGAGSLPRAAQVPSAAQQAVGNINKLKEATGVEVTVPKAAASDSTAIQRTQRIVSHIPGGSAPAVAAAQRTAGELGAASDAAAQIPKGIETTPEIAGSTAREAVESRVGSAKEAEEIPEGRPTPLANKVNQAYDAVDDLIPGNPTHDLKNTRAVAQQIMDEVGATGKEAMPAEVQEVLGAVTNPDGITYQGLKRLRSRIGGLRDMGAVNSGMETGDLRRLYGALSDDMRELLQTNGGWRAVSKWERANDLARATADVRTRLRGILGGATRSDEGIFEAIAGKAITGARADLNVLRRTREAMGKDWDEVASALVRRMGWTGAGDHRAFDPGKFLRDYGKLHPDAKNILFGTRGQLRDALDSLSAVAENWGTIKDQAHASGEVAHAVGLLGIFHHPIKFLGTIFGANRLSRMLSSPVTAQSASNWAKRYQALRLNPNQNNFTAYANAARTVVNDENRSLPEGIATGMKWGGYYGKQAIEKFMDILPSRAPIQVRIGGQ